MKDLDNSQALQFLQKHSSMVISTLSGNNELASAHVFYTINDQSELLFLTNKSTKKYTNVQSHKNIAFVVTDEENLLTLQGSGEVSEISDQNELIAAFDNLIKVIAKRIENWPPPAGQQPHPDLAILKIKPTWMRLRDYHNTSSMTL